MKQVFNSTLFLCLMLHIVCSSCVNTIPYEEEIPTSQSKLDIFARSSATLNYPIQVYAFDAEGKYASGQSIASTSEVLSLNLSAGSYRIVALSGATDDAYILPEASTLTATIAMKSGNYATTSPLMIGSADVTLTDQAAKVDITLNYKVTSITTALSGVPTDADAVSIRFSSFAETVGLDGTSSGSSFVEVPCAKQLDGTWTHPELYTFAGSEAQTVLSISITSGVKTQTYGYTYAAPLKAAIPFVLQGAYAGGIVINGDIIAGEWGTPVAIEFPFGPNGGGGGTDPDPDPDPDPELPAIEIPAVGTMWNGCLVALVSNATTTSADLLLFSPDEWTGLPAASAPAAVAAYKHNGWTDWRIPTQDEAKLLKSTFGMKGTFDKANKALVEAELSPLSNADDIRYLCNEGLHSYRFDYGSSVTAAGDKRTYNMRAVRAMHITKE